MGCGRKIGDFDCCSIVQGDCLELMKRLNAKSFDAVITDPPYGIGITRSQRLVKERGFVCSAWDDSPATPEQVEQILRVGEAAIVWGGNYFDLPPTRCFLVWDKCNAGRDFADCEMAWTNVDAVARMFQFRPQNMDGGKVHPTQKPLALMEWCIKQIGDVRNVLDPFAGSGTTLVAAKKLGCHYLGFELNADYCAIAQKRLDEVDANPMLFAPRPEQLGLEING